ncbi:Virulence factors putative positive transcription regulator BvgA [Planctomycetes bacterium Pan216]|uniref:Virulence factors putative positive transcription regulator BvgA n=1 Tax=Kolteria novifilia TaxID=2527975 RepID=A0A518B4V7_9BACT|nr:Virulence factors putative positive transcription regulator BvgA [Planctomycetes bacterium Pan216]
MSESRLTKVYIIDDHPVFRRGVSALIEHADDLTVCGESAGSLAELDEVIAAEPDVVLVDISLKETNGLEVVKRLRVRDSRMRLLVVSNHSEAIYAERCLRAGAAGFINKQEAAEELLVAIRKVVTGSFYLSTKTTDDIVSRITRSKHEEEGWSSVNGLSDRELQVFELVGRGHSRQEIAERLHLSPKTVDAYRDNVKSKLGFKDANELVRAAVQWVFLENSG